MPERRIRTEDDRLALFHALTDVRGRILADAGSLPTHARDRVFLGVWSAADLLAHLVGWDHANCEAAGEILAGRLPSFYTYHDRDWAGFNAMLVARYKRDDYEALLADAANSHADLIAAIARIPVEELDRDRGIRFRGWKVTIARLLQVEQRDEEEHWRQLRDFAASLRPLD